VLSFLDFLLIDLGQAVDIIVIALDSEVLCQIDDLHVLRDGVLLEESLALAMSEAEEDDVDLVERHFVSKLQIGLANESFVDIANEVASVAL